MVAQLALEIRYDEHKHKDPHAGDGEVGSEEWCGASQPKLAAGLALEELLPKFEAVSLAELHTCGTTPMDLRAAHAQRTAISNLLDAVTQRTSALQRMLGDKRSPDGVPEGERSAPSPRRD